MYVHLVYVIELAVLEVAAGRDGGLRHLLGIVGNFPGDSGCVRELIKLVEILNSTSTRTRSLFDCIVTTRTFQRSAMHMHSA